MSCTANKTFGGKRKQRKTRRTKMGGGSLNPLTPSNVDGPTQIGAAAYEVAAVGTTPTANPVGGVNANPSAYVGGKGVFDWCMSASKTKSRSKRSRSFKKRRRSNRRYSRGRR